MPNRFRNSKLRSFKKAILLSLLFFFFGLLPYFYLPYAAAKNPPLNFGDPFFFENFWRVITRADYGTFQVGSGSELFNYQFAKGQWRFFLLSAAQNFSLLLIFFLLGIFWLGKAGRKLSFSFLLLFFFTSFIFLSFLSFPLEFSYDFNVASRFHLLPLLLISATLLPLGLYYFLHLLSKPSSSTILLFIPFFFFFGNFSSAKQFSSSLGLDLSRAVLDSLPSNSLVLSAGDFYTVYFPYLELVEKERNDVVLIDLGKLYNLWYQRQIIERYPNVAKSSFFDGLDSLYVQRIVDENFNLRPIFVYSSLNALPNLEQKYELVPWGILQKVYLKPSLLDSQKLFEENISQINNLDFSFKQVAQKESPESLNQVVVSHYLAGYFHLGVYLLPRGFLNEALYAFDKIVSFYEDKNQIFDPNVVSAFKNAGLIYLQEGEKEKGFHLLRKYSEFNPQDKQIKKMLYSKDNL